MRMLSALHHKSSIAFLLLFPILLLRSQEFVSAAVVTLNSIEIYTTHEWFNSKPTVYFQCKGENKTFLPDVKGKHTTYMFKGEESWQPLTELLSRKCKRCGLYEEDPIKSDVFDEWELCASDFNGSDGQYSHFKEKEFNAKFICVECASLLVDSSSDSKKSSGSQTAEKGMHWALIVVISVLVSALFTLGLVIAVKYLQKRKRQKEQARFSKLFEDDDDDIEDELGISPLSSPL